MCTGRESVHCLQPREGHKGQWHITKEMINGFGICINFFLVKSHEDFYWFYYHVCTNPKHTCCIDLIHSYSAFMYPLLLSCEASLLPLFSCRSKNLLPLLQAKLFLKNNSVYPEMLPSLHTWSAESSKFCEGFRLNERLLEREHCSA